MAIGAAMGGKTNKGDYFSEIGIKVFFLSPNK